MYMSPLYFYLKLICFDLVHLSALSRKYKVLTGQLPFRVCHMYLSRHICVIT